MRAPLLIGSLIFLTWLTPAWAYRPLRPAVTHQDSSQPVVLVDVSSSFQDTPRVMDGRWDTTLTLKRQGEADARPISGLEIELVLYGSQGDELETVTTVVQIPGLWKNAETRQVRLQREYLGWPATIIQGRVIKVLYTEGEPWTLPLEAVPITEKPQREPEEFTLSTDSPYIPPALLSPGGSSGTTAPRTTRSRPVRPRPVRPRQPSANTNPPNTVAPNNNATVGSNSSSTNNLSNRPSLFQSVNQSGQTNAQKGTTAPTPTRPIQPQPVGQPDDGEEQNR